MEISGYHTPKRSLMKMKQNGLYIQNNSPNHSIKRRKSSIPFSIFKSFQNNYENSNKESLSLKKPLKRYFSGHIIPEEQENKIKDNKKMPKNSFTNLINKIYTKESHLNKNIIKNKIKKNYISNKTFFNTPKNRNRNNSINTNKDRLTINSYYNTPKNNYKHKLCEKIDSLLHKEQLTKNEKEIILNFFDKSRNSLSSPKHKRDKSFSIKSPIIKKRNKNNDSNLEENEKNSKDRTKLNGNDNPSFFRWFNTFLCCLKTN